jgi:hypothetical protein
MLFLLLEQEHSVLFLASKLFLSGKRLSSKQNLQSRLTVEDNVRFDAVPCEQSENDSSCSWFATVVWKGKKPYTDYDAPISPFTEPWSVMAEMKYVSFYSSRQYRTNNWSRSEHCMDLPQSNLHPPVYLIKVNKI